MGPAQLKDIFGKHLGWPLYEWFVLNKKQILREGGLHKPLSKKEMSPLVA